MPINRRERLVPTGRGDLCISRLLKLTSLIVLFCLACLSQANSSPAEDNQQVSLRFVNASLRNVLDSLAEQIQVDFVYDERDIRGITVSCDVPNSSLYAALKLVLHPTSLTFEILQDLRMVILRPKKPGNQQTFVYGRVSEGNGMPLAAVNVFIANSMLGAATKKNGFFIIPKVPIGTFDLIASRIGYAIFKQELVTRQGGTLVVIELTAKPYQAPAIEVSAKAMDEWRRDFDKFSNLFFSTTENADQCSIQNPTVLDFSRNGRIFLATARAPLIIENRALGYKIRYVMEYFSASRTRIWMRGFSHFEELESTTPGQRDKWRRNRLRAYYGSMKHFLASVCRKEQRLVILPDRNVVLNDEYFSQSGFRAFLSTDPWNKEQGLTPIRDTSRLLSETDESYRRLLSFPAFLMVAYTGEGADDDHSDIGVKSVLPDAQLSMITLTTDSVIVDTYGNIYDGNGLRVDGFGLRTYGHWSWERMADRLPWDYQHSDSTPVHPDIILRAQDHVQ